MRREPIQYPYVCFAARDYTEWRRNDGSTYIEWHRQEIIQRAERKRRRGTQRKH